MKLVDRAAAVAGSTHTGRALKVAKVLNLIGTVRGAVTTVLLASSAIGGAVTVNNVRQDIVQSNAAAAASASARSRTTASPTASPVTAAGLRADAERRLRAALDQDAAGTDDLRRVTVLSPESTDELIAQTRQKLEARFDLALTQIDQLLGTATPSAGASARPAASLSVVTLNSIVQVALADLNGILVAATRIATTVPAAAPTLRTAPVVTSAPTSTRTPAATPTRSATPSPRPSPTR